jgi:hypothetical protein
MAKLCHINNVNKQVKYDSVAITLQPLNIHEVAVVTLKYVTKICSLLISSLIKSQININQYHQVTEL